MEELAFEIPVDIPVGVTLSADGTAQEQPSSGGGEVIDAFNRRTAADVRAERAKSFLSDGVALNLVDRYLTALLVGQPNDPVGYLIRVLQEDAEATKNSSSGGHNNNAGATVANQVARQGDADEGGGANTSGGQSSPRTRAISSMSPADRKMQLAAVRESTQAYARRHHLAYLVDELIAALLDERPADPTAFMIWWLKQNKKGFLNRYVPLQS